MDESALAKEEARQLELALAASLADQAVPAYPPPNPKSTTWGTIGGSINSTLPNHNPNHASTSRTPPSPTPKASNTVGGPEGFAFIPGFGNILDQGSKTSPKPSSSVGFGSETSNGNLASRQRRPGVSGGPAGAPWSGESVQGGSLLRSQDEKDRELALKLATEENRRGPRKSEEERDRLLALKLQEEEARSLEVVAHPSPIPSDEDIARNLQQQLDLEDRMANGLAPPGADSPAPSGGFRLPLGGSLGSLPQIPTPRQKLSNLGPAGGQEVCARCQQPITGRYLKAGDQIWHVDCLVCKLCGQTIKGELRVQHGDTYHEDCHRRHNHPKCSVCKMPIPANENRMIEYRSRPFWRDTYCPVHEHDGTAQCCACDRMEPMDQQYVTLDDGRKLCLECCSSVVVDTADCQPLYREVLEFYETMGMRLRQKDIPLLLVERQALNEAQEREHSGGPANPGSHHPATTRGLCLSEEQIIYSVVRRPTGRLGPHQGLSHETEQQVVRRHCDVTAILILFGLPRLLTGSILAHELMHAWVKLDGTFPQLDPEIEEGICQVLAHMWLQTQLPARVGSAARPTQTLADDSGVRISDDDRVRTEGEVTERLAEFFLHGIEMNPTAVYGAGFRAGHAAVVKFGLETILEHMRMTGTFPA